MTEIDKSLIEITTNLGINHEVNKTAKKDLEQSRGEFFDAATKALEEGILAQRNVEAPRQTGGQRDIIETWIAKWHPGWRVVAIENTEDGYDVQLEEDPALKKFVFVNPDDEHVYQRNAIQGNPSVDDDLLKSEDPDLWERISNPVPYQGLELLRDFCEFMDIGYSDMMGWIKAVQSGTDWPRVLVDPEEISDEDLAKMQKYLVPGSISLRLESPRVAKPEELEGDG